MTEIWCRSLDDDVCVFHKRINLTALSIFQTVHLINLPLRLAQHTISLTARPRQPPKVSQTTARDSSSRFRRQSIGRFRGEAVRPSSRAAECSHNRKPLIPRTVEQYGDSATTLLAAGSAQSYLIPTRIVQCYASTSLPVTITGLFSSRP